MSENNLSRYQKLSITLTSYLKGRGFNRALEAFQYAKEIHVGYRKDGVTPNFQHQIEICLFLMNLKEIRKDIEEEVFVGAFLHDIREDYGISYQTIEAKFGKTAAEVNEKLTKEFKGAKKSPEVYFNDITNCPICSLIKGGDRIHNFSSMVGVFTIPKQEHYVFEVKEYFLPMLKKAAQLFPDQSASYHLMRTFLKNMSIAIEQALKVEKELLVTNPTEKTKHKP